MGNKICSLLLVISGKLWYIHKEVDIMHGGYYAV